MAQFGNVIPGPLGLGAIDAESASAANVQGGQLLPLSGANASSDERQKLSRKPHILADIAEIGDYLRGWTPTKIQALKLQQVNEVYPLHPLLTGEAALDVIKVSEWDQQRRVYYTKVVALDAVYNSHHIKAQAMMTGWVNYILTLHMQYMLDNYRSRYPRQAPPTRGANGEEILGEMLRHAYDGIGMMKEVLTRLDCVTRTGMSRSSAPCAGPCCLTTALRATSLTTCDDAE